MTLPVDNKTATVWRWLTEALARHFPAKEAYALGRELFEHCCGIATDQRVLYPEAPLSESCIQQLHWGINRLVKGEPVQYITGKTTFLDFEFKVSPQVLIPRPETEELVIWLLEHIRKKLSREKRKMTILDVGTGSGCIAVSLAAKLPGAEVLACDYKKIILEVAKHNALINNVEVSFILMDVLSDFRPIPLLDFLVSNPPYVMKKEKKKMQANVLDYEPEHALFVEDTDPLVFYRAICEKGMKWLKPGGWIYFEINESLGSKAFDLIERNGFIKVELKQDINGKDRFIRARKPVRPV